MIRIRELRKQNGITAKKLGEIIHVAESTISLYENGKRAPDYDTLCRIADYFGVSVDYLLGREEHKKKPAAPKNDELWDAICANETKLKIANQIAQMDDDSLRRLIAIMEAALLTPPE